jgi:hypothetical protein
MDTKTKKAVAKLDMRLSLAVATMKTSDQQEIQRPLLHLL